MPTLGFLESGVVCLLAYKVVQWFFFFFFWWWWLERGVDPSKFHPYWCRIHSSDSEIKGQTQYEIIWDLDNKGVFFVKTTYFLVLSLLIWMQLTHWKGQPPNLWRHPSKSRKPPPPPKAKICCWRIVIDIFPTKYHLSKNDVHPDVRCMFCRKHV